MNNQYNRIMTISFKILILALVAAAVFAGCSRLKADRTRAIEPDGFVSDPTVEPLCADTKAQVPYEVLEARRGDFIRISIADDCDRKALSSTVSELALAYSRVDVCHPEFTERGDQYLSFVGDIVCDFNAGRSMPISEWIAL